MRETPFKAQLIEKLYTMFPGCCILRNDPRHLQGVPDITVLFGPCWAMLETKAFKTASRQPNQEHYINQFNEMSFAAFIYPENEEEVLDALQYAFDSGRPTRISRG